MSSCFSLVFMFCLVFFFFKQKTAYEMRISDWSSDVCSSDLADAFKTTPEGHTGGSLNMVPAFVGYLAANALSARTRAWLMGQGHSVAAIEAVNALTGDVSRAQQGRYDRSEAGLSRLAADFYSYAIAADGAAAVPLGSHAGPNTAGAISEGGYLGFAEVQYVHRSEEHTSEIQSL